MPNLRKKITYLFENKLRNNFPYIEQAVVDLNNFQELKKIFDWKKNPLLDEPETYTYKYIEDANERRIRDAESLATVMRNINPKVALEIGTASGISTTLMSLNSPTAKIYTVNIPPEEIIAGEGGKFTTIALEKEKIGSVFKAKGLKNIVQIYANTAKWKPKIKNIELAFIDGCHDAEFVYNDTRKVLKLMAPNGFILWHDFNFDLRKKHVWINDVCQGIEKLFRKGFLKGRIYHIRDSWVGIYRV